jgi:hypothetical protein
MTVGDAIMEDVETTSNALTQGLTELELCIKASRRILREMRYLIDELQGAYDYMLGNEAMRQLPALLLRDHGLRVQGRLKRQYVRDAEGQPIEVNIFGTAERDGEEVVIVGESKSQLSKNDVDRFLRRTVDALRGVYPQVLPLLVTHMTSEPDVEEYARSLGVALCYSYEF